MDVWRFERQVGLHTLFRGVGQDSKFFFSLCEMVSAQSKSWFIQHRLHFSLSFFLLCGNHRKTFSVNICCDPETLVWGTALSARDTKTTETRYWQCDNTLKYVTWRCSLLLLAFALPEGGLFLLEESGQMCSRWTESCLRSICCTSWVALTLASTCLTPASFSSEPSYFYAYIMRQTKWWWKFLNAEFGMNAFLFLEIHVLILSGYFHSNRHNT